VSRAEAERLIGPLRHPPYRVGGTSREANATGDFCRYEARNGRRFLIEPTWKDARMQMNIMASMGRLVEQAITTDSGQADTLEGRWDELRMLPGDNIYARQGDDLVMVDYLGSGIGLEGAARVAHIALGRMHHPLAYDGAAAGRNAPGPLVAPRDPCSLVDRADFERIVGALSGPPAPNTHKDKCTYTLAQARGLLGGNKVEINITWTDAWAALQNARGSVGVVTSKVAPPVARGTQDGVSSGGAGAGKPDSQFGAFMGRIMDVARSQGIGVQANSSGGLTTDTLVAGPWDRGELHSGLGLLVVKKDVLLSIDLRGITYEQAKALLGKAVQRL
jgi:hypothetical protein